MKNELKIKTLTGCKLTTGNKNSIKAILKAGLMSGRIGRTDYFLQLTEGIYTVAIKYMGRGLIPCGGSDLRLHTDITTFEYRGIK